MFRWPLTLLFGVLGALSPAADIPTFPRAICIDELYRNSEELRDMFLNFLSTGPHPVRRQASDFIRDHFTERKALPAIIPSETLITQLDRKLAAHVRYWGAIDRSVVAAFVSTVLELAGNTLAVRVYDDLHLDLADDGKVVITIAETEERAEFDLEEWIVSHFAQGRPGSILLGKMVWPLGKGVSAALMNVDPPSEKKGEE